MSRKVFLSFLGTNNYVPCNYYMEHDPSLAISNVKYIQEALIRMNINELSENDGIIFFTTALSFKMNYKDNGQWNAATKDYSLPNIGLESALKDLDLTTPFKNVDIKEGFSETEIWEVFETISNEIQQDDQIILDITHAFRYLPMLGVVLTDFLKVVKNATVIGLYYGAFEKLGPASEVLKMDIKERNAPILNLLPLIELQRWVNAVGNFVSHGIAKDLIDLTAPSINPIVRQTLGKDLVAGNLKAMNSKLADLIPALLTNRGKELMSFKWQHLSETLNTLKEAELIIKPLKQVFGIIYDKISPLATAKQIWIESAKWCLKHNLVQQGLTQLKEGLITYLIQIARQNTSDTFYEVSEEEARVLISYGLVVLHKKIPKEEWKKEVMENESKFETLIQIGTLQPFSEINYQITESRNDINHSGFKTNATNAATLKKKLEIYLAEVEKLVYKN